MQAEVTRERPAIDPAEEHALIRADEISAILLHGAKTHAPAEVLLGADLLESLQADRDASSPAPALAYRLADLLG